MLRALAELKPEERAALALCFQQGLTHDEAAAVLDVPLGTLKSHVARGKDHLAALEGLVDALVTGDLSRP